VRLTPVDIANQTFAVRLRGYDRRQVDEFLQQLYEDYGAVVAELAALRGEAERAQERLGHYEKIEETLRNALVLAQNTLEETRERARGERDAIVREAEQRRRDILDEAADERARLEAELADLKRQRRAFEAEFAALLRSHLRALEPEPEAAAHAPEPHEPVPEPDNGGVEEPEAAVAGASAVGWWEEDC
jgi:cell division initiation protein